MILSILSVYCSLYIHIQFFLNLPNNDETENKIIYYNYRYFLQSNII